MRRETIWYEGHTHTKERREPHATGEDSTATRKHTQQAPEHKLSKRYAHPRAKPTNARYGKENRRRPWDDKSDVSMPSVPPSPASRTVFRSPMVANAAEGSRANHGHREQPTQEQTGNILDTQRTTEKEST